MSVTEAFYRLREAVVFDVRNTIVNNEALDTIHAAMESLKGANVALEAEVVRIKGELEQAQAACAEMRETIIKYMHPGGSPESYKRCQAALSSTCGTALLEELRELREALSVAINTVECASIDLKTGEELPWHKMATKALRSFKAKHEK